MHGTLGNRPIWWDTCRGNPYYARVDQLLILGMVIPALIGNPYNKYIYNGLWKGYTSNLWQHFHQLTVMKLNGHVEALSEIPTNIATKTEVNSRPAVAPFFVQHEMPFFLSKTRKA